MTTVYTKPACEPCKATKRFLTARGIPFREVALADVDPAQVSAWQERGLLAAPIVEAPDGRVWAGFRPDSLASLA